MSVMGRVIRSYQSTCPNPIVMKVGDRLQVEDKPTNWAGWLWCLHPSGKSSWVPENYLNREGDSALALQDYNATELSVQESQELDILNEEAGWFWCTGGDGESGWVPAENIELI
jgi:hypothetical protein